MSMLRSRSRSLLPGLALAALLYLLLTLLIRVPVEASGVFNASSIFTLAPQTVQTTSFFTSATGTFDVIPTTTETGQLVAVDMFANTSGIGSNCGTSPQGTINLYFDGAAASTIPFTMFCVATASGTAQFKTTGPCVDVILPSAAGLYTSNSGAFARTTCFLNLPYKTSIRVAIQITATDVNGPQIVAAAMRAKRQ